MAIIILYILMGVNALSTGVFTFLGFLESNVYYYSIACASLVLILLEFLAVTHFENQATIIKELKKLTKDCKEDYEI